ncbi:MAG: zf-HC2 domain-containing protein [Candidatus Zixiibacteriota bacterium]
MKCLKARKLIYLLLEGDLDQKEKQDLLGHLKSCQNCQLELEDAKRSHLIWKAALREEAMPPFSKQEFVEGVKKRIEAQKQIILERSARPKVISFLAAHRKLAYAATIVIVAFLSLWFGVFSQRAKKVPQKVVVHSAYLDDQKKAEFSISQSEDKHVVFIWLEEPDKGS